MQSPLFRGANSTTTLQEAADSPKWSFTREKGASVTRTFRGTYALALASRPPVNAFGTGIYAGMRITAVTVEQQKPGIGQLSWTMEGAPLVNGLPELPPDEADVEPADQEFRLEKHPLFKTIDLDDLSAINAALSANKEEDRAQYEDTIYATADPEVTIALYEKMKFGQTHFTLGLPKYRWTFSSLTLPVLDEGGYLQYPYGPIPVPPGFPWLRKSDAFSWTGSYWKVTRIWQALINPDADIYPVNIASL